LVECSPQYNVILIPGLGGSILEGVWKMNMSHTEWYCKNTLTYEQIWPTIYQIIPVVDWCWYYRILPQISNNGMSFSSTGGVKIRAKDFGGLSGISVLDDISFYFWNVPIGVYYKPTIKHLKSTNHTSILGAPYDFRLILDRTILRNYVSNLKNLIENSLYKKSVIIAHSMGGLLSTYFLNCMENKWKETYILKFITVSTPWGGAPKALESSMSGDQDGIPVAKLMMKNIEKSTAGVIWTFPFPKRWKNIPIIRTPSKNYTASNIYDILMAVGERDTANSWYNSRDIREKSILYPNVDTFLVYGKNISTAYQAEYSDSFVFKGWINKDGDGTVPSYSLNSNHWPIKEKYIIDGADHLEILRTDVWLNILDVIIS